MDNAAAMAARVDVSTKKTGTAKRDIDYVNEYVAFAADLEKTAKAGGDVSAAMAKVRDALAIGAADAEIDAFYAKRKGAKA